MMSNTLELLKQVSSVVADTGDFQELEQYKPDDCTTNPSLILQAASNPKYKDMVANIVRETATRCKNMPANIGAFTETQIVEECCDALAVAFGCEILKIVSGYVSTEIDACMSFDTRATVLKGKKIVKMYEAKGVSKDRLLLKIASTWEGILACKELTAEGYKCNMTLIFSFYQAVACAQAKAFLISPFVGRILDWYKKNAPDVDYTGSNDPGVKSVAEIYQFFKTYGYETIIMGASFRNTSEILELAGCDKLTIGAGLLKELIETRCSKENFTQKLSKSTAKTERKDTPITTEIFRWNMNEEQMSTDKLSEGIRNFNKDHEKLKAMVLTMVRSL